MSVKRKIFISIVVILAILGVIVYYGINYVYNVIGNNMISQLDSIQNSIVQDNNLQVIVGSDKTDNKNNSKINKMTDNSGDTKTSDISSSNGQGINRDSIAKQSDTKDKTGDGSKNVSNGQGKSRDVQKEKQPVEISLSDKLKEIQLITSRLSPSDIAKLEQLARGGLTPEEKKEAIAIAYSRFTPKEIQEIKKLYHKYVR